MTKIAVDIALLLPADINQICIDINQWWDAHPFSNLSRKDNYPHITLAMAIIDEEDIGEINKSLNELSKDFSTLNLEMINLSYSVYDNQRSYAFDISLTDSIKRLHIAVMKKLWSFFLLCPIEDKMFFVDSDEIFHEVSKYRLGKIREKCAFPEYYSPHITLKCRNAKYDNLPLSFIASELVLCHLWNYCTCRTILGHHRLS
jgi:2'-5' RNA ligase